MDFQAEKRLVQDYYAALDAPGADLGAVMDRYIADEYIWRGYHPFHEQTSGRAVAEVFWQPLRTALTSLQRRMDIFIAGRNEIDGFNSTWVISMGHLMGLFDAPWLGIPPTGKIAMMRYCEFNKVESGKITETAMFFDIPQVMMQAGLRPFPPQTGTHLIQPGPRTHDGLCFADQDPGAGEKTLGVINFMIGDMGDWEGAVEEPLEVELPRVCGISARTYRPVRGTSGIHRLYPGTVRDRRGQVCSLSVAPLPAHAQHQKIHGCACIRGCRRNARCGPLPTRRRQAGGKLDFHRHATFSETAGA